MFRVKGSIKAIEKIVNAMITAVLFTRIPLGSGFLYFTVSLFIYFRLDHAWICTYLAFRPKPKPAKRMVSAAAFPTSSSK
jgi:hypothetical protein